MKITIFVIFFLLTTFCSTFSIQQSDPLPFNNNIKSQYYGNLTEQQKQSIRDAITVASYKTDDVSDISQYVGDTLDRLWGKSWQTYVYGNKCTQSQISSTTIYQNRWAVFNSYGPLKYCYYVYQERNCRAQLMKMPKNSNGESWGQSFKLADREKIKNLILESAIRSDVMTDNANYIRSKLGNGDWSVAIGDPQDTDFGFYACIVGDYWGMLWEYGPYGWAYIVLKYR